MVINDQDAQPIEPLDPRRGRGRRRRGSPLQELDRLTCSTGAGWNRQTNGERGATPYALAGRVHGSPVQFHELTDDAKPKTESGVALRRRVFSLAEPPEHVWQKVRADALACIDDPD